MDDEFVAGGIIAILSSLFAIFVIFVLNKLFFSSDPFLFIDVFIPLFVFLILFRILQEVFDW